MKLLKKIKSYNNKIGIGTKFKIEKEGYVVVGFQGKNNVICRSQKNSRIDVFSKDQVRDKQETHKLGWNASESINYDSEPTRVVTEYDEELDDDEESFYLEDEEDL